MNGDLSLLVVALAMGAAAMFFRRADTHGGKRPHRNPTVEIFFAPSPFQRVVGPIKFRIANKVVVATLTLI